MTRTSWVSSDTAILSLCLLALTGLGDEKISSSCSSVRPSAKEKKKER